jgi:hypothetical protein
MILTGTMLLFHFTAEREDVNMLEVTFCYMENAPRTSIFFIRTLVLLPFEILRLSLYGKPQAMGDVYENL